MYHNGRPFHKVRSEVNRLMVSGYWHQQQALALNFELVLVKTTASVLLLIYDKGELLRRKSSTITVGVDVTSLL